MYSCSYVTYWYKYSPWLSAALEEEVWQMVLQKPWLNEGASQSWFFSDYLSLGVLIFARLRKSRSLNLFVFIDSIWTSYSLNTLMSPSHNLRRNPPEVWALSGHKPRLFKLYQVPRLLHCISNFCTTVLNIFSKKVILETPDVERKCCTSYETLYWWNEIDKILPVCAQSLWTLKYTSLIPMGKCFWCYMRELFTS